jgi:predicted DNA-binding transcriptional regulator YafY
VARVEYLVEPYSLVVKQGVWRLVSNRAGRLRVQRVDGLLEVEPTGETFTRPDDFALEAFWRAWCAAREQQSRLYTVTVRVAPHFLPWLPHFIGDAVDERPGKSGIEDEDGWTRIQLSFESLDAARERLLGCGAGVEVLEPLALRWSLLDVAQQVAALYGKPGK